MIPRQSKTDADHVHDEECPDWRVFQHDTEAGRLLSRLYGVQPGGKPQINYPKLKTRKSCSTERAHWKSPGQGEVDRKRAGFDRRRAASVSVPKVGSAVRRGETASAVTFIPRRKNEVACHEDLACIESVRHTFRPPNRSEYSTDREKDRLNELFTYGGGVALPEELTLPEAPLPSEEKHRRVEARRVEKAKCRRQARRNRGSKEDEDDLSDDSSLSNSRESEAMSDKGHNDRMFDQVLGEIEERRMFQFSMEEASSGALTRAQIADEISSRMKELVKLDERRACTMMQDFQTSNR
uniref:Uncharacterized protein n=1 Tax=Odontella aurita TaxID=265563 RepID=A0A7S4MSU8_9STRA|mmetsp:Transcript_3099/g.8082  ORF Transcript_3099/g.8082 Transcript_3099/m.8082 type:complete len:296 (+) Transcript_3099:937-1824(+)